jgi:hypothetical protein
MSSIATATAANEACRVALVEEWVTSNSTLQGEKVETLQSIQQTNELFAIAESYCQGYVKAYNVAAGRTCILQQQPSPSNVTYTEFWEGVGNMDGSYTLAAIIDRTDNFTLDPKINMCNNDCYVSEAGEPGCINAQSFVPLIGQISQSHVCYNEWSEMDDAWNELRVCAATAIFDSDDHFDDAQHLDEKAKVEMFQDQRDQSVLCARKACAKLTTDSTTSKSESTRLTPPGGRRGGVVIIVSSLMMLFLLTYT